MKLWHVDGVRAVSVGTWRISWQCQSLVGDTLSVGSSPACARFDIVDLRDWYLVKGEHFGTDMGQGWLFAEQIATAGHAVVQRDAFYL